MSQIQCYATLADLAADLESGNFPPDALARFILPASDYIREAIGPFIPETRSMKMAAHEDSPYLLFTPALLSITTIQDNGVTLNGLDYILKPEGRHWPDGPYSYLGIPETSTNHQQWTWWLAQGIQIDGLWGYYNKTASSGAVVATGGQASGASTLVVDDGSKLSPGRILLIESEQEFIDGYGAPATATTITAALDAATEEISLANGTLVKVGEIARLDFEQIMILSIQGNKAQVARGWGNTKKSAHSTGTNLEAYRTFSTQRAVNGTSAATHAQNTAVSTYVVPNQVNYLTRQIATLMLKKAQSGYAGKTGNETLGTTFYFHEFPRDEIDRIRKNYWIPRGG